VRRYYYRRGSGRYREMGRGMPARFAVIALLVLAGIVVLASLMHAPGR
jgi:hypothetical protein